MTTETTATKKTRFTINQALEAVLSFIEGYIVPFDEEKMTKRLTAMNVGTAEEIAEIVARKKARIESKVNLAEVDAKKTEAFAIFKTFYEEEAKHRERITLPSILEPLAAKGTDENELWFALEKFVSDAEERKAEALKKLAGAKK